MAETPVGKSALCSMLCGGAAESSGVPRMGSGRVLDAGGAAGRGVRTCFRFGLAGFVSGRQGDEKVERSGFPDGF